mmetsp:Transcript_44069/g.125711  ORF Transcript_44069/g.125711 Transcript_44069/m.125711 type:complete len:363 (-) Transcript_44069:416-1504(-)
MEVCLCVLVGLTDGRFHSPLPSLLALRNHVGTTHDLGTEAPALPPGSFEVPDNTALHPLEVGLISVEDGVPTVKVVFPLERKHHVVDCGLDVDPLGIHHDAHLKRLCQVQDALDPGAHVGVELQLLLVQAGPVERPLGNASPNQVVDLRELEAGGPVHVGDEPVIILVERLEREAELLLTLPCEELLPARTEGLKIQCEGPINAVVRLGEVGSRVTVPDTLEKPDNLHQACRHALQQDWVPQAGKFDSSETIRGGIVDCPDGVQKYLRVRIAHCLAPIVIVPGTLWRPDGACLIRGVHDLRQRVLLRLGSVVQDSTNPVLLQLVHARNDLQSIFPGTKVVEETVPQNPVRQARSKDFQACRI